jgi:hypothetical protein
MRRLAVALALAAVALAKYFIRHARAAFAEMGADGTMAAARDIAAWVTSRGDATFLRRDCHRAYEHRFQHVEDLQPVLDVLATHEWIRRLPKRPSGPKGGRSPEGEYAVNPEALRLNRHSGTQPSPAPPFT